MIIDYKQIYNIDTSFFNKYFGSHAVTFCQPRGEHYKLLSYISQQYNGITILDVGTLRGASCLALAQNKNNKVITYDINNTETTPNKWDPHVATLPFLDDYPNVTRKIMDINVESADIINSAEIILLDIIHDGVTEKKFSDMLDKIGYKGYVFCDDVFSHMHPACTQWFENIKIEKYNLTEVGHHHGTGLLNYYNDNSVHIKKYSPNYMPPYLNSLSL